MNRGHAHIEAIWHKAGHLHYMWPNLNRSQVPRDLRCMHSSATPALPSSFCSCSPSAPAFPSSLLSFSFPCSFPFLFPCAAFLLFPERVAAEWSEHAARDSKSLWGQDCVCRPLCLLSSSFQLWGLQSCPGYLKNKIALKWERVILSIPKSPWPLCNRFITIHKFNNIIVVSM